MATGLSFMYTRVVQTITKKVEDRQKYELLALEEWFRKKSKVLKDVRSGKPSDETSSFFFCDEDKSSPIVKIGSHAY